MRVLGIETSCDETGVALYEAGVGIRAERLASQIPIHAAYGGVVPELASRDHIAKLLPMVENVLADAQVELRGLDAIAYTAGPGLIGALMVGGALASSLAYALKIPAIPVHHLEGHILACMLEAPAPEFPFLALMVSGGHSQLIEVLGVGRYRIVGETLDDAAGEAFDKVARLLGLPYPGGPELAALAERGDGRRFSLPRRRRLVAGAPPRRRRGIVSSGGRRHPDGQVPAGARGDGPPAARRRRRRRGQPRVAHEPRGARPASRRTRVLSEAGTVHRQRRHDRVRGLVSADHGRAGAANRGAAAVAARRARAAAIED